MPLDQGHDGTEMSFLDHLEELRWHIIRAAIALVICTVALLILKDLVVIPFIFGPTQADFATYKGLCNLSHHFGWNDRLCFEPIQTEIRNIGITEKFTAHIKVSIVLGFMVALPYILWELWRFIKPGLKKAEIKSVNGFVFFCTLLFVLGASFAYFLILPFSFNFLVGYDFGPEGMTGPEFLRLKDYINYITMVVLGAGIIFELPILVYFLAKLGIMGPSFMRKQRRLAFVVILVLSAIITPPDIMSQVLIGIPVFLLYEIGILIAARVYKKSEAES